MFLSVFDLQKTGRYFPAPDLPDHALCVLCLERKANYLAMYRLLKTNLLHPRKICWVCLNKDFLKETPEPTSGGAA